MTSFESMPHGMVPPEAAPDAEETLNEPSNPETAVETFNPSQLRPGDQFFDTEERKYEVRRIISVPGDEEKGSILLRWYKKPGNTPDFDVSFKRFAEQAFLGNDVTIVRYDRPRVPEGVDLKQFKEYNRWEIATKQIDEMLKEKDLEVSERDRLNVAKANIAREIVAAIKKQNTE